ncbi:RNA polymerase beta subunit [Vibrio phage USC-1]|uniref:DNA-directed RNA polymerase n=2 Tax=Aphroditevirus USC1 TaxID=2846605 RepID=A0A514A2M9_9CAUD|nr:RNA polymerase beta subunit [Vibrio phage USC-1]QCW23223.1 hypothetical protein [Vibrio phage 5 TSL-2019]QDH47505.1 hypothetical protein [Vibrio phage USC-1]
MKVYKIDNQILPEVTSIAINLAANPHNAASGRKYMSGNMIPKSCRAKGITKRRITSGFERQYGDHARKIVAPSNMEVELVIYRKSIKSQDARTDDWGEIHVVYFDADLQRYDVLHLPKYHTHNFYVGFEYDYDKQMLNRLRKGATYAKGEIFAKSPGIDDTGEWKFGLETMVAGMTLPSTEEDGIMVRDDYLDRLMVMFEHVRKFSWNEAEYIPVNLYGTLDNPKAFPENGERVRDDGLVMAFRRRDGNSGLASLTKKALMKPDLLYDVKFYAPPHSIVKNIEVRSERLKDRSNNRRVEKPSYAHTKLLEMYETEDNNMWYTLKMWYIHQIKKFGSDETLPFSNELLAFIYQSFGNVTKDYALNKPNFTKRTHRNKSLLDWNVKVTLKEDVAGKVRFKLSDLNGGKGVIVKVFKKEDAPVDEYGRSPEIIVNNTPAFRRQIYASLMEASINFINLNVYDEVMKYRESGDYDKAYQSLLDFYEVTSPEFFRIVETVGKGDPNFKFDHVDYIKKEGMISIQRRSDSEIVGVEVIRRLSERYGQWKPTPVTFTNDLGQREKTLEPVIISSMHYLLLDKFGTEMSSESFPKRNLYGLPAKLNANDKYNKHYRSKVDRNTGETEARIAISHEGGEETARMLTLANSPEAARMGIKRIIRADDPFAVPELVKREEYRTNRALQLTMNMLTDAGYELRTENENDLTS